MMKPYEAYRQHSAIGWTRIELVLALLSGAVERIELASQAQARGDRIGMLSMVIRVQRIVAELLNGLDLSLGEIPRNLQRLYFFALRSITATNPDFDSAIRVLRTVQQGMEGIRDEANAMERRGEIPPANASPMLQATG